MLFLQAPHNLQRNERDGKSRRNRRKLGRLTFPLAEYIRRCWRRPPEMTGWCDELRLNSFTFPLWVLGATFTLQPIHYYPYKNFRSLENISTINWNYWFSKWFFYQNFSTGRPISTDCCISFKYLNTNLLYLVIITVRVMATWNTWKLLFVHLIKKDLVL